MMDRTVALMRDVGQLALRLTIAASFLLAVADRLGVLGVLGDPGVSWGSWEVFRDYTARLVPVRVDVVIDTAAVMVTLLETVLSILLTLGLFVREASLAAAALTLVFGVSMLLFVAPLAPFAYPVFVFTAAALLLAGLPRYRWSADAARRARADSSPVRGEQ